MTAYGGLEKELQSFLTSALDETEWCTSRLGHPIPGTKPRYELNIKRGGPQGRSGLLEKRQMSLPCREPPHDSSHRPLRNLVIISTALSQLLTFKHTKLNLIALLWRPQLA